MPTNPSENTNPFDSEKEKIELLKQEYKMAADRYENIYKAIWQIFQYVAALSAAILAFGSNNLPLGLVGILSVIPLLFWYYVTFVPLNRYGDKVGCRLASIEKNLNTHVFEISRSQDSDDNAKIALYTNFQDRRSKSDASIYILRYLVKIKNWKFSRWALKWVKWVIGLPRVRKRIWRFGLLYILTLFVAVIVAVIYATKNPKKQQASSDIEHVLRTVNSNHKEVLILMQQLKEQISDMEVQSMGFNEKERQPALFETEAPDSTTKSESITNNE